MNKRKNNNLIFEKLEQTYQGMTTSLNYSSPFELLIATILSAQTNDNQVNKITDELFKQYNTPQHFINFTVEELEKYIKTCGLYKNKARNIINASKIIVEKHQGNVPKTREELMELPGVGRKTANVVLSNAFDIPALAVDTHVFRVANRLGLVEAKTPEEVEFQLMKQISQHLWGDAHHWLIWHGRKICVARNPKCKECPVAMLCPTYNNWGEDN